MAEKLNDDCWLSVLKYLEVENQVNFAAVSQRFHTIARYYWRLLQKTKIEKKALKALEEQPEIEKSFLECASPCLQEMELKDCAVRQLNVWQNYRFPKLRILNCEMKHNKAGADEETLLLTQLFPNLVALTLYSSTTGRNIWFWDHLEELHLVWCEYLDTDTFREIFTKLKLRKVTVLYYGYNVNLGHGVSHITKCQSLEELAIDDMHLTGDFLPGLLSLPNFRKLAFYTRDYLDYTMDVIARKHPQRVASLLFHDALWNNYEAAELVIRSFPNIRRLVLQDDHLDPRVLHKLCVQLTNLEELHLMKARALPTPPQLWNMVAASSSLKLLNLSHTRLEKFFLTDSKLYLKPVLDKRAFPLQLNLHNTSLKSREIKAVLKHPNLVILCTPIHINIWSSRFLEVELMVNEK